MRERESARARRRQPGTVRYLRRLYEDPNTGNSKWGIVRASDGGITGVYILSDQTRLKMSSFAVRDAGFEGKVHWSVRSLRWSTS